jgi:hypothetical protein
VNTYFIGNSRAFLCCAVGWKLEDIAMITRQELCKKIEEVFPQAGACGIDYDVEFDGKAGAWAVDLHHGAQHLKTFIETDEADSCLEGKSCIPLGMQIAQLKRNFDLTSCSE